MAANLTSCLYSSAVHMAVFLFFPRLQKQLTFSGLSSLKCFAQSEQLLRSSRCEFFQLGPLPDMHFFPEEKKILSITRLRLTGHRSEDHMNRWDQNAPHVSVSFAFYKFRRKIRLTKCAQQRLHVPTLAALQVYAHCQKT